MTDKVIDLQTTNPAAYRLMELLHGVFVGTPLGKELLELLIQRYLYMPCAHEKMPDWYAYYRDGENNVIRTIMSLIEQFNQIQGAKK